MTQFGAPRLRRLHHRVGKSRRVNLRSGLRGAELLRHDRLGRQPSEIVVRAALCEPAPSPGDPAISGQAAIAPISREGRSEFRVQGKAAARQRGKRRAVTPITRQKTTRLA